MDFSILSHTGVGLTIVVYIAFFVALYLIAAYDWRTRQIPNVAVAGMAAVWLAWRVVLGIFACVVGGQDFLSALLEGAPLSALSTPDSLLGAILLGGGMLVLTVVFEALTKHPAMGGGDIKLFAVIGLYLGIWGGLICLFFSCIAALLISAFAKVPAVAEDENTTGHSVVPFAPGIAIGATITALIWVVTSSVPNLL